MSSREIRAAVRQRAGGRCEYCRLPDWVDSTDPFHVEHVQPRQHAGGDDLKNLAWACSRCNRHKGTNLGAIDPLTGQRVWLFIPRDEGWEDHFFYEGARIQGRTPKGRATVWLLQMNMDRRVEIRRLLQEAGLLL